ncbi:MAG: mechanosensitive ion channel family protein [Vulcanimicrobiaceae bacterium]
MHLRSLIIVPTFLAFVCALGVPGVAQVLPGIAVPSAAPVQLPGSTGIRQDGLYLTAPISVDGNPLFRIAVQGTTGQSQTALIERSQTIDAAVAQLLATVSNGKTAGTVYSPGSLEIDVQPDADQQLLVAIDKTHTAPLPILTVTSVDAKYHKQTAAALAQSWRATLQSALVAALLKRQPAEIKRNYNDLVLVGIGMLLGTLLLWGLFAFVQQRARFVRAEVESSERTVDRVQSEGSPEQEHASGWRERFIAATVHAAEPEQRLAILRSIAAAIVWSGILGWVGAIAWALLLFPQTIPFGQVLIRTVLGVATIWIVAALLDRVLDVVIGRVSRAYTMPLRSASEDETRGALRAPTVARAIGGFKTFVLIFVAALATLSQLGIPIGSVVTIGGIAALAITFAAQNLVRDFLNGFLVLLEDQYVVGDYIQIGTWNGIVEHLTLRVVQIRDGRGNVITIPHSSAIQVVNSSRNWSRIDYRVAVDQSANLGQAIALLRSTIEDLAREDAWREAVLDAVEWIGVEAVSNSGITLRASIKTAPLRQFELRREINARIITAFRDAKVILGSDPGTPTITLAAASPDPE